MEMIKTLFEAEVKAADESALTIDHFISTEKLDRGGDVLYADGMKMFGKPVVLWVHGRSDNIGPEPIAKPVWIKKGEFKGNKGILARTQFYPDETGKRLWDKAANGYIPNWSVGWRPLRHEYKTAKNGKEERHVFEWELLEYSLVPVPMQPDAQSIEGRKDAIKEILFKIQPESPQLPLGEKPGEKPPEKPVEKKEDDPKPPELEPDPILQQKAGEKHICKVCGFEIFSTKYGADGAVVKFLCACSIEEMVEAVRKQIPDPKQLEATIMENVKTALAPPAPVPPKPGDPPKEQPPGPKRLVFREAVDPEDGKNTDLLKRLVREALTEEANKQVRKLTGKVD